MALEQTLSWPFFEDRHRQFAFEIARWADAKAQSFRDDDVDAGCRARVSALGDAGWLKPIASSHNGGLYSSIDVRTLCLAREILAARDALLDFAFAMQGLGTVSISLFGSPALQARYLPAALAGRSIGAFALSEPEAGSDVAAITTTAVPDGGSHVRLNGTKTWVSNGGIADHYVVFARSGEAAGARGLSAFVVDAQTPGLHVLERIEVIAPHPLATLQFENARVPLANRLGQGGEGFKVAMASLDVFRPTVGAAALGFARRALDEMLARSTARKLFGNTLADLQLTQAAIAESATEIDAAALLVYRAAWSKDQGATRITRAAAMAKMFATEAAQRVIDRAVQIHGGLGVTKGVVVEKLYRQIRGLRIYEGATEVQKIVIARELLRAREIFGHGCRIGFQGGTFDSSRR
jgi:acyl-CoA dehydrogenase